MLPSRHRHHVICLVLIISSVAISRATAFDLSRIPHPTARIARFFDPELVRTEDRLAWLDNRIASFAPHREHSMKVDLGYRGYRAENAADPTVTLDLGSEYPVDKVILIPTQREYVGDLGIFPKRFTIELSNVADFSQASRIFTSKNDTPFSTVIRPHPFAANERARYVRLTVHAGTSQGMVDLFGLSELVVISNRDPVSFGATVTCTGSLLSPGAWYPETLTDGRTPFGIWQNPGRVKNRPNDHIAVSSVDETVTWTVELPKTSPVDRVILFPYQLDGFFESSVLSESITVSLETGNGQQESAIFQWSNRPVGANFMTPLVIPTKGSPAKSVRITGVRPHTTGELKVHALSEIEVWSAGTNLAADLPVVCSHAGQSTILDTLTDGFTSGRQIIPVAAWLEQLYERGKIENELAKLRPVYIQRSFESELNATWGSAVVLGLTFMIPVFILERRRLMSREHLDFLRKRIASDLHDDIGSNLGSISLIARSARKDLVRLAGPDEVANDLGEVEVIARESSLAMRDIVWLLERREDSIGDLVQRMRETAKRMLRELTHTLECSSRKTGAKLSLDAKRHLLLFYKEGIHNVLKHSQATRVSIRLWDENDLLALEIHDNGVGLGTADGDAQSHKMVSKLKDRAAALAGVIHVTSSEGNGTRVLLLVKHSTLTANRILNES